MKEFTNNSSRNNITLSWHDLSLRVKMKCQESLNPFKARYEEKFILQNLSGIVKSGELLAIMGPSGSGKTTLLATISQRIKGITTGTILINGKSLTKNQLIEMSGFAPQNDLMIDSLNVMEHMNFMAVMKLDVAVNKVERRKRINKILTDLGLLEYKNLKLSKLSGGQRKRLTLAVQLITDPSILFCDEPTTSLDSFTAFCVVERLRLLTVSGKTVIATIHQPASGILDMFDSVYLMTSGGKLTIQASPVDIASFFESINLKCPSHYNLAEYFVQQTAINENSDSETKLNYIINNYEKSDYCEKIKIELNRCLNVNYHNFFNEPLISLLWSDSLSNECRKTKSSQTLTKLYWLIWRSGLEMIRKPQQHLTRLILYLILAYLISIPYKNIEINDQSSVQNLQGLLYLLVVETVFMFSYSVSTTFPQEIPILLREARNGLYSPILYYLSKIILLIPCTLLEPILFTAIVFWNAGLFGGFLGFLQISLIVIGCAITSTAYGCFLSAVFESVTTSSLLSVPFENIGLMFCGIYMSLSDIPLHFIWVKYVSIFYYGMEAVSILQWSEVSIIPCPSTNDLPCISNGLGVLSYYGYSKNNLKIDIGGLIFLYIICHIIGMLALIKRSFSQPTY